MTNQTRRNIDVYVNWFAVVAPHMCLKDHICLKVGIVLILTTYYWSRSMIHSGRHMPFNPIFIRR